MLLITKHSRFHRAVVSAAALMTVAGGIAEALPISAEAQTFSYPQPTAPQPTPGYPYLQQPPTAQGVDPYGHSYPYYPQPTAPPTAPAYPYQLHQQQPMAQGTTDQLNREELGRLQSGNGYSPYYSASGSPPGWGWGSPSGWGWGSPSGWGWGSPWGWGWGSPWGWGWGSRWGWGWPIGASVGFGGCWNCGFRGAFFRPGFGRFGFAHPGFGRFGFAHPGFGRFGFAHAGFGGGFRGGFRGGGRR